MNEAGDERGIGGSVDDPGLDKDEDADSTRAIKDRSDTGEGSFRREGLRFGTLQPDPRCQTTILRRCQLATSAKDHRERQRGEEGVHEL